MAVATTTMLTVAAIAASTAYSASEQQKAGKRAAKASEHQGTASATEARVNAELARIDAERIERSANIEASKIREAAIQMRGQEEAASASAGADVTSGSALVVKEDTTKRAEADALATVMEGIYGSLNKEASARYSEMAGQNAAQSAALSGEAALLSANSAAGTTIANGFVSAISTYGNMKKK